MVIDMPSKKNRMGEDMVRAAANKVNARAKQSALSCICLLGMLMLGSISCSDPAHAAGGDILWQYNDARTGKQEALASAVDSAGNTIIVGYAVNGSEDFYTAKVKADGSGTLWTATFDLAGSTDRATAVVVDQNDDVLVSGYAWNGSNYDFHTIKYNAADGSVAWQSTFNSTAGGSDIPTAISTDSLNNVYVAGYSEGSSGTDDFQLIKYTPAGPNPDGTPVWQRSYNGGASGQDRINAMAAGIDGVVVSGYSHNGTDFDYLTIKYGFDGGQTWLKVHDSALGDDRALATALDSAGHVLVTGLAYNGTGQDVLTIKYRDSDGTVLWSRPYDGGYADQGKYLWIDAADNVYLSGTSFTLSGFTDLYTAKYAAADGSVIWEKIYNSGGDNTDIPVGILADEGGEVFVAGYTTKVSADNDILVVKYKKDNGTQLWASSFNGAAGKDDKAVGIGTGPAGHLLVGGWSDIWTSGATDYDYKAIKYDAGLLNPPTGLSAAAVSNTAVELAWTDNSANEDGFKIWRKLGELGTWSQVATVSAGVTAYSDTGLTSHVWYHYKVQAFNAGDGDSHFTNEDDALTTVIGYPAPSWSYIFNNPDNGDDYAYAIAVGPDNHPVVTGSSLTSANGTYMSQDYHTVKLDRANANELWSVGYNDVDDEMDIATGVVVDENNDVIVSGFSSLYNGGASNTNDIYTLKYPASGPPPFGNPELWADQYNGPAGDDDRSESVDSAVDGSNSIVVTGYGKNASANDDIYVVKYLADGTRQWAATPFNGAANGNDYPARIVFDANGDVVVTGRTHNGADYDIFTRKLNGSDGTPVWTVIYDSTNGRDIGRDTAVDNNGDVYVTGVVVNGSGNDDLYLAKYDGTDGALLWAKTVDGPANGNDIGDAVLVDANTNQVAVAGTVLAGAGNNDFYLARYAADGTALWVQQLERATHDDVAVAMGMDMSGNVCVAGNTDNASSIDLLAVIYDNYGNVVGGTLFNGTADSDDDAFAVAVNGLGEQFVSGYTTNASGNADYLVIKCMGEVLQAPAPFSVSPGYTSVDLAWTDNTSDEDGFHVERKLGDCNSANPWELVQTTAADTVSYIDTGLNKSTSYCYRVRTFKNSGMVSTWLENEATTTEPPPPSDFTATPVNTTRIDLAWTDNTTGEEGFLVERCSGSGCSDYTLLVQTAANATTYSDETVCESQVYSYRILAFKTGDWQSEYSAPDTDNTTPSMAVPTGFTAARVSEGEILLTWADNTSDETGFNIERCTGSSCSDFAALATTAADTTSYNDTAGLEPNTTYRYRINAAKSAGCSWTTAWTPVAETTTTLATPAGLSATDVNTTRIDLTWTDTFGFETGFEVERCTGTGCSDFAALTTVGAGITSYQDTTVCEAGTYVYRVRGNRTSLPAWSSGWSNTATGTAQAKQAPDNLTAVRVSEEILSLTWNDNSADETGFEIDRCAGAGCDFSLKTTITVAADTTSYVDNPLTPDTTYRYRIRAYKSADCPWQSAYSVGAEATTSLYPPDSLTASAADTTTIDLTWSDNTGHETGFVLERCSGSGCSDFAAVARIAADTESYSDSGACADTSHSYRIIAVDEGLSNAGGGCWTRKTPLTVSGFQANATMRIVVAHDTDMQADFADIRFFDQTAKEELPYWIPDKTDSTSATVWIRAGDNNDIAMYYGNSTAASSSNPTPFGVEFAENFPGTMIDPASWVEIDPDNAIEQNDDLVLHDLVDGWTKALISQQAFSRTAGRTLYIDLAINADTPGANYFMTGWERDQTTNPSFNQLVHGLYWSNTSFTTYQYGGNTGVTTNPGYTWNTGYEMKIALKASGADYYQKAASSSAWTLIHTRTDRTDATMRIGFTQYSHQASIHLVAVVSDGSLLPEARATAGTEEQSVCYAFDTWQSGYSNTATATTPAAAAPTSLTATAASESQIDLSWTDNAADETGYKVERCEGAGCSDFAVIDTLAADTTAYSDTGLTLATSYSYRVQSYKDSDCPWDQAYSNVATELTMSPPPPSDLTAITANTTQIDLAWTDNTGAESGFSIERCTGAGCSDFSEIATVGADITSYTDISAVHSTSYTYQVKAVNSTVPWTSAASNTATDTTQTPGVPSSLTASRVSEVQIDLAWVDNTIDETNFRIERGAGDCTGFAEIGTADPDVTSYSDSGLAVDTTYCYRVRAYKAATNEWYTAYSDTASASTTIAAPGAFSATVVNTTQIDLGWTDNSSSETGFAIERCSGAGCSDFTLLATTAADTTSYSDTGGVHSTVYNYRVRAVSTIVPWNSGYSSVQSATTPAPAAPTGLTAVRVSEIEIALSWTDNGNDETGFKIERCPGTGCSDFVQIGQVPSDATSYQDTGLAFATTFTYRIRAYKTTTNSWDSAYSNTSNATTTVAGPSGMTATPADTTAIDLSWTDNTVSETGFAIERCQGPGCGDFTPIGTAAENATSYTDTSACNAQTYTYRVRSVRGADWNSPYSNSAEASTPAWIAPTGLDVVSHTQDSLELSWTDNSPDESGFKIERCQGAGCSTFAEITTVAADSISHIDTAGINPSTTYCYRLRATKTATCGWDSAYSNTACDLTIQAAATTLSASAVNSMMIRLDWTDNANDEEAYEVYQKIWNGSYVLMDTLPPDSVTYTKTFGINPATEYFFKVRTVRGADLSAFSNEASETTPAWLTGDGTCEE